MSTVMNFKRMDVNGVTKEEALAKAPFNAAFKNATSAFKKFCENAKDGVTESDIKQFELDYLAKNTKNAEGLGCYVVIESAVVDTRERPYKIENVKSEGSRKWGTVFQIYENIGTKTKPVAGQRLVDNAGKTKAEAREAAKKLYTEKGIRMNVVVMPAKVVVEGEPIAFTVEYTPSKSSHIGRYHVFGIEKA